MILRSFDVTACLLVCAVVGLSWPVTAVFTLVFLLQNLSTVPRLELSALDDLPGLVGRWAVAVGAAVVADTVMAQVGLGLTIGRDLLMWGAAASLLVLIIFRAAAAAAVRRLRATRRLSRRTLVVGAGVIGCQLAAAMHRHPQYGLLPVGFLDGDPWSDHERTPVPILGRESQLAEALAEHRIDDVVVAFGAMPESQVVEIIRTCDRHGAEVFIVPRLFELHHVVGDHMDNVWGMPLVRLRRASHRTFAWDCKRVFDYVVAASALVVLAPVLLLAALAVRREGGPGVLFRQVRVGIDGREFEVLKFRTLKPASDSEAQTTWNIALDDRLGPVGRFLRKSSIDELPQLINILRGDMSLVGPRPERPHFVQQFQAAYPGYTARHRVPSGLTGWAQVHGLRGDTSIEDRARFDNYYIENWSLWLDLKIILRTVSAVLTGAGG